MSKFHDSLPHAKATICGQPHRRLACRSAYVGMSLLGFTDNKDANMSDDPSVNPPFGDTSSDKADRMRDFFTRHGGPSGDPIHHGETERGTSGWTETYAKDGYALRCDWSRTGGKEEMQFVELLRPPHR
jgi:hypothetical protein